MDSDAPVRAGDKLARRFAFGTAIQSGLMQTKSDLDNVRNPFAGHALSLLILEGVDIAACGLETLLEMLGADDAEMLWSYRLAVPPHRGQELGNATAIDPIDAEEVG